MTKEKKVKEKIDDTKGITVKKADDMPEWYGQVCVKAGLADYSPIRGFMVIKPNGMAIWENIQRAFDDMIKANGVKNAYFPLLIPESFFKREAEHAEGFSPEVAWIEKRNDGEKDEERYAIRPTSETIMYDSYSKWIRSWRDLPLKINQWCNIVRWEVQDTKLFLRSREFLWQEGHCVYETKEERDKETLLYIELYRKLVEDYLAVPLIVGEKTPRERFAGADQTFTIEGLMPDGKALQSGTTHNLNQGFAKSFNINFQDREGNMSLPYQNSWGFSTRLIGAIVMTHGDDKGLVLPPRIAKNKIAIIPILFEQSKAQVLEKVNEVAKTLDEYGVIVDDREEYKPGWKFAQYELEGIPLRIEIGPKDVEKGQVVIARRDTSKKEFVKFADLKKRIPELLDEMHNSMFNKAKADVDSKIIEVSNYEDFQKAIKDKKMPYCHHCGSEDCELAIKEETAATTRCIPLESEKVSSKDKCIKCGKPSKYKLYFARAY